jgi:hypothetical protein
MEDGYPSFDAQNRNGAYTLFKKTILRDPGMSHFREQGLFNT